MNGYGPISLIDVAAPNFSYFSTNIGKLLGVTPAKVSIGKFADGERNVVIEDSVRGRDVFVLQTYQDPLSEGFADLEYTLSAMHSGGGANRITAVLPYCHGMRGERQTKPRQSVPIEVVVRKLYALGVDAVLTVCLHTESIATMFRTTGERKGIKLEHLPFEPLAANYIINTAKERGYDDFVVASPDTGGAKRAEKTIEMIVQASNFRPVLAMCHKSRKEGTEAVEIKAVAGNVYNKAVFVYDDIGDTLGTMREAVEALKQNGAREVYVLFAHPVLGNGFSSKLEALCGDDQVKEIVFGNSIPLKGIASEHEKVRVIELEPFVAKAIQNLNNNSPMSDLHKYATIVQLYEGSKGLMDDQTEKCIRIRA